MREEELTYKGIHGIPVILEPGNAARVDRSSWRLVRPVYNKDKCIMCKICYTYCPDSAIVWTKEGPVINLTSCKGCMICAEECPTDAMSEEKEAS